jgi:D-alanyl-lipoteichoic acid acyltransferase DltB (MBOAT superfamily)
VLVLYWSLRHGAQNALLLVASYLFYGAWDWRFLGLLVVSTVVDYGVGIGLGATTDRRRRRLLLGASLATNLGILGFFKYAGFFVDSAVDLLSMFGVEGHRTTLSILLPVGISFYSFQTLSYTIDVYRRHLQPTRSLLDFATFVAFFPQLVAGPIERATNLLPEISRPRARPSLEQVRSGCFLILLGLFKKVAIADVMANQVDVAFGNAEVGHGHWLMLLAGTYAFALQIYGDFSGYSDIARGTSRLFGIELMINFEQPYLSRTITEFWRRWHISLSTWLRDYLYIPLGGNRRGRRRTSINLALVMLLGGLWHGAAWTFVAWGALHGFYLAADRWTGRESFPAQAPLTLRQVPAMVLTFHLVCLSWVFFRAGSLSSALDYLGQIASFSGGPFVPSNLSLLVGAALVMLLLDLDQRIRLSHTAPLAWPDWARGAAYGTALTGIVLFSGGPPQAFLYFQF